MKTSLYPYHSRFRRGLQAFCIGTATLCAAGLIAGASVPETARPADLVMIHCNTSALMEPVVLELDRYALSDAERDLVERTVMAEAGTEDFDGMCLVAQCVRNTAEARDMRPGEVVTEKNQYTKPAAVASELAKEAVEAVFDRGYAVTEEPIRFFYAPAWGVSWWHESQAFVLEHGSHRFFKMRNPK